MVSQDDVNDREWADERNWTGWLGTYRSTTDSRTWVPKRNPQMGWTLNFAHAGAWWSLLGLSIVPLGVLLLVALLIATR